MSISFRVNGTPAAQGSMKHIGNGRMVSMSKKLPGWRKAIIAAAHKEAGPGWDPMDGPLKVIVDFYLPRPASTKFKDYPAGTPDLDKLQRALGDALTMSGLIQDDARIVSWNADKHWAIGCEPGAQVSVYRKGLL